MSAPFTRHKGKVAVLARADVDTDQIVPKQFLKRVERDGFGQFLFNDWRFRPDGTPNLDFELNHPDAQGATILLTGANFGCGSSREHAVWALREYGFRVIVAPSFADIFYGNCCENGVLAARLDGRAIDELQRRVRGGRGGYALTVDLLTQRVSDAQGFDEGFAIAPYHRDLLLQGLDPIGRTLREEPRIAAYEARRGGGSMKTFRVVVLPGDGIGPEVTVEAVRVLEAASERFRFGLDLEYCAIGAAGVAAAGEPFPAETRAAVTRADAVLLGAVGDPSLDGAPRHLRPETALLALRQLLGVFANLRPVEPHPALLEHSPLKSERLRGVNLLIVRELTGGLYYGEPRGRDGERAVNTMTYTVPEIERVARLAFEAAHRRRRVVTSVDKANVLEVSQLWRETVTRVAADYADVRLEHCYVDTAAMRLVTAPAGFDVLLTENMFGDILSDEAAVLTGALGLLPSASLGAGAGLFEPVHGSAPDIAGRGIANPLGAVASAALLLRHGLGLHAAADAVDRAVGNLLDAGIRTADLAAPGGPVTGTREVGERLADLVAQAVPVA